MAGNFDYNSYIQGSNFGNQSGLNYGNFSGVDPSQWAYDAFSSGGGTNAYNQHLSPYMNQQVQHRINTVDVGEGQQQQFMEFLNPITGVWDRADNQITASNPWAGEGDAPSNWDYGYGNSFQVNSGGYEIDDKDLLLNPYLQYDRGEDGNYYVRGGGYDQEMATDSFEMMDLAGIAAVAGGAIGLQGGLGNFMNNLGTANPYGGSFMPGMDGGLGGSFNPAGGAGGAGGGTGVTLGNTPIGSGEAGYTNGMDGVSDLASQYPSYNPTPPLENPFLGEGVPSGIEGWDQAYQGAGGTFDPGYLSGAGNGTMPTDHNYMNGSDIQSDLATSSGVAPPGAVNAGVNTTVPGATIAQPGTPGGTPAGPPGGGTTPPPGGGIPGGGGNGSGSGGGLNLGNLLGLLAGGYDMNQQKEASANMLNWLKERQAMNDNMYKPGSAEANALWDEMSRKDAASGRNSQYGPRSVDLASRIAQLKMDANTKMTTGIGAFMANSLNQNASAHAGLASQLGNLFGEGGGLDIDVSLDDITGWLDGLFD